MDELRSVLREQVAYYRARAGEYDRWWLRQGRYDRGPEATRRWFDEGEEVREAFDALPLDGADVLELAPGTGLWTERLAARANRVTAIDASAEMIQQCKDRLGPLADRVDFALADLFDWEPDRSYDVVVFCFWISHIPDDMLDAFLEKVARALRPGGWLFFLDGRPEPTSTATDHVLPSPDAEVMVRRLDDGQEFRIIKNFWSFDELQRRLSHAGLTAEVRETANYFQFAIGAKIS
jgi:demethylmenaquinone methyltransferase/2-methoxy-6-polyprenyl-1,4-benzoquinol methylase